MGSENAPEFVQKIQFSIEYKNELNVVGDLQNLITTDFEITSLSTSEVRNTFKTSQKIKILVRILMIFQSEKSQKLGPKSQILKVAAVQLMNKLLESLS